MIYLLRRYFQISARQYLDEVPDWEVDVLLRELDADMKAQRES